MPVVINDADDPKIALCFVCETPYDLRGGLEGILAHLYFNHRILVENKKTYIFNFKEYMDHYREMYQRLNFLDEICKTVYQPVLDSKIYILGDSVPGDKILRKRIHKKVYDAAKAQHAIDMSDTLYTKDCFYCHKTMKTTRISFVKHLWKHGFQLGRPCNLVFIENFMDAICEIFTGLRCMFCLNNFTTKNKLVTHMIENDHKKINPEIKYFDQFYMFNYKSYGKTRQHFERYDLNNVRQVGEHYEQEQACNNNGNTVIIYCVFCLHRCHCWNGVLLHMAVSHSIDFKENIMRFRFFDQIKIVNFIRKRISDLQCISCNAQFLTKDSLLAHAEMNRHLRIPDRRLWESPEYCFSIMHDDALLNYLEDPVYIEPCTNIIAYNAPRSIDGSSPLR